MIEKYSQQNRTRTIPQPNKVYLIKYIVNLLLIGKKNISNGIEKCGVLIK